MRALISTSTFPLSAQDATPRFVLDLAVALAAHGEVSVLAPGVPGAPKRETMEGVAVRRFTYFYPPSLQRLAYGGMVENLRRSKIALLQPLPLILAQALATRSIVRSEGVDVVNSHWMIPQGLSTALARGRKKRFGHVLSVHAADVYMLHRIPFGRAIARFIMARTDRVFADGSHVRDFLDDLLIEKSNATLQPMGVKTAQFGDFETKEPMESPFEEGYLLFFGRFSEKKGVTYLLQALPKILEAHPKLGLVVIGYGELEAALREESAKLGIEASVQFTGRKTHTEIVRYLHGCEVAVVPSIIDSHGETEGMPTVIVESLAAGAKVVGSAVDGIPDVIRHTENGWLCREKDPEDLAEKILTALDHPKTPDFLQTVHESAATHDWERVAARYAHAFAQAAGTSTGQ